ncbi:MAG: DUF2188 domain-containing protein [Candidatus Hydrogenedentes bacterium]|nr:DUF2188 domain-containing protein [Candidatus Hydrogenedentota bacterium]
MKERTWFYVSRAPQGWKVHCDSWRREEKIFKDKREAIKYGREIARQHEHSLLVIQ